MKQLNVIPLALLLTFPLAIHAQGDDQKITVEITKEVDGEKKTFKGEYDSAEEMQADPNYQEFTGEDKNFNIWFNSGGQDIAINLNKMKEVDKHIFRIFEDEDHPNSFYYHLDDDSSNVFDFKVGDFDSDEFREKIERLGIEMGESIKYLNFYEVDDDSRILEKKRIRVAEVEGEFGKRGKVEKNERLELEDLNFHPNPSSDGKLKIQFNTSEENELSIAISNFEGKDVFNRYFESFSGRYSETIDLSGQKEGMYLLEISQGRRKITRKIIIN